MIGTQALILSNCSESECYGLDPSGSDYPPLSLAFLQRVIASLHGEFVVTDLGSLTYFLGISAQRSFTGLFLSQSTYADEIRERAHMQEYNSCRTHVDTESKLGADGEPLIQQVCLYMHDLQEPHLDALKRILRYVGVTIDHGLQLHVSSTSQPTAYTDADWAGFPVTRRSTSGYCVFLDDNLFSWSANRQVTFSRSSVKAEYIGVANVVAEAGWVHNLLRELHAPLFTARLVYCDNVSVVYLSTNPIQHQRTKHIEIDIYFVCDFVLMDNVHVLNVHLRFSYE
ncbi:ribonuclease H-like domain-containing protein [Tanacetum coccineum]